MGNSTQELFSQSNPYHASSDTSLFSSSLPVLSHEKFKVNGESFLPDEDEFLSEMVDELVADSEEYDLFGSGGGLELEPDFHESLRVGVGGLNLTESDVGSGGSRVGPIAGEHPLGEHPSRTLFVRNINSNVEDAEIRSLFEQYGDIRTMYTASKHRGFVMISYYDIRTARIAMRALQNKPLRRRKLDIHFSIPKENPSETDINQGTLVAFNLDPSVSNDELRQIFGAYGEVKEIRETPHKRYHKFIEFYDVRAAEAALKSLNRRDIAGKRIKLEHSRPGGVRRSSLLHPNGDPEQDEGNSHHIGNSISPPVGNWAQLNICKSPIFGSCNHPFVNSVPGLTSVLKHKAGPNSSPIGSHYLSHIFANGSSNSRGFFQQSHSFPEQNLSSLFNWPISSFSGSTSKPLRGPHQLFCGNNGFDFLDHHKFGYFQDSTNGPFVGPGYEGYKDQIFGRNLVMNNGSPVFGMSSSSRPSHVVLGNNHFLDLSNMEGLRAFEMRGMQSDNKEHFRLDLDKITGGEDARTTIMIKNIPNKYTSKMLMAAIDEHHKGTYDFLYLPIDFKNKCNVGYAFINMLSPLSIIPFYEEFNGKKWEKFNSEKVALLAFARIQGKAALVSHFQNSSLMNEDKRCRPIIFDSESTDINDAIVLEELRACSLSRNSRQSNGDQINER